MYTPVWYTALCGLEKIQNKFELVYLTQVLDEYM